MLHSGRYNESQFARLASVVRRATEAKRQVIITPELLPTLIEGAIPPADPMEAADNVLLYLHAHSPSFGSRIPFQISTSYPLFTLKNAGELNNVVNYMADQHWISLTPGVTTLSVTMLASGYARVRELEFTSKLSRRAFVAMSFNQSLDDAYQNGVKPAIISAGFQPIRVDEVPHNERIDDLIIRELRRSAFVVADFSDIRSGVFFEAGFGLGLGLTVIWTCQQSTFPELSKHFDTRQFYYVVWQHPEDLRERLANRILATVPGAREVANSGETA